MKKETITRHYFATRQSWRSWLRLNHERDGGIWLLFFKKHLRRGLSYDDAVEEALCFGWIDGQLRRIDDRRHMLRFSPRRRGSVWAPSNIARVKRLMNEKKMTPAGLAVFRSAKLSKQTAPSAKIQRVIRIPPDLRGALVANRKAWMHFQNYPKSFRRTAIFWVTSAKQPETRMRRIRNIVTNAAKHPKPQY